jgi:hypothetical protein
MASNGLLEEQPTALRLSLRSRNAQDGHLAGLLTHASANSSAFPGVQWHCAQLSAITVAGQWRILTALPKNQMGKVISECEGGVKRGSWYVVMRLLTLGFFLECQLQSSRNASLRRDRSS